MYLLLPYLTIKTKTNVGKYTSPMDGMGIRDEYLSLFTSERNVSFASSGPRPRGRLSTPWKWAEIFNSHQGVIDTQRIHGRTRMFTIYLPTWIINLLIVKWYRYIFPTNMDPLAYADFQEIFANKIHRGFFFSIGGQLSKKKHVGRFKIFSVAPSPTGVQKPHFGCFESQTDESNVSVSNVRVAFLVDLGALQIFLAHVTSSRL